MSTVDVLADLLTRRLQGVILDKRQGRDKSVIEFEAKIFTSKKRREEETVFHVAEVHWQNLKNAFAAQGLRQVTSTIRSIGFLHYPDRFRIVEEEGVTSFTHEYKFRFSDPYDDELSWVRYSIAEEITSYQFPESEIETLTEKISEKEHRLATVSYERFLKRTTYYPVSAQFRSLVKVDMSEVFDTDGNTHYEVEIEMLDPLTNYVRMKEYLLFCQKVIALFRGTDTFYNTVVYENFCAMINMNAVFKNVSGKTNNPIPRRYVDKAIFNQVRTLKKEDLVTGGIINGKTQYGAFLKTDGFRFALIFCSLGIWLVWPPYTYNLISPTTVFRNEDLTILDGELIPKDKRNHTEDKEYKYVYQVFDVIYVRGMDTRTVFLPDRLSAVKEYLDAIRLENILGSLLRIYMKRATLVSQAEDFFLINERLLQEVDNKESDFVYEGIVWNPWNTAYSMGIDIDLETTVRTLLTNPEIVKWKDASLTTIDFRYTIVNGEKLLMVSEWEEVTPGEKIAKDVVFRGDTRYPFDQATMVDWQSIEDNNVLINSIGEYSFDRARRKFVFMRDRSEKAHPNTNETVAIPNWQEINFPITREAITGKSFQLMFYYHLRVKTTLMNEASETLLDLGAGQGGIIWRWTRYQRIVAVEPNEAHRKEFIRRAALANLTVVPEDGVLPDDDERFVILIAGTAQETARIEKQVKRIAPQGVNCVSLLDVGTFLWQTPEILEQSMNTIQRCLAPGGKFVWKMMNGDLVRSLPQIKEDEKKRRDTKNKVVYGNFELHYETREGKVEDKVRVYIPEGITSEGHEDGLQTEWLTSVEEMYTFFPEKDYEYLYRKLCNEEAFMPKNSLLLSQLFEYGVIRKRGVISKEVEKQAETSEVRSMQLRKRPVGRGGGVRAQVLGGTAPASQTTRPRATPAQRPASRIQARKTVKIASGEEELNLDEI